MQDLKLNCLLEKTESILKQLIQHEIMKNFVLVGGSALALYICHRKSEDLDFFTYDDFDLMKIKEFLKEFDNKEFVNISEDQIDVFIDNVKVTFFNAKWKFLKPDIIKNFNIASMENICVMKTNTLFMRAKYRDYYDLYFLNKHFTLKEIYNFSKEILDGINLKLFITALLFIDDIEDENLDYLELIEKISLKEIRNIFEMKIKKEL